MASYRGKYVMGGAKTGQPMDWLQPGDELSLVTAGKNIKLSVKDTYRYENRRVYVTDRFGLIFADELVAYTMPVWNKNASVFRKSEAI
jgi:hypothetical protein